MRRFVEEGPRTGSPVPERPRTATGKPSEAELVERRRLADTARVNVPNTHVGSESQHGSDGRSLRQNMSRQRQQTAAQPAVHSQRMHLHGFDTDSEHADDTTFLNFSNGSAQDDLRQQHVHATQAHGVDEDYGSVDGDESQSADEESEVDQKRSITQRDMEELYAEKRRLDLVQHNSLSTPHSYPPTTIPDEEDEDPHGTYTGNDYGPRSPEPNQYYPYPTPQEHFHQARSHAQDDAFRQLRQAAPRKVVPATSIPVRNIAVQPKIARPLSAKPIQQQQQQRYTPPPPSAHPQPEDPQPPQHALRPSTVSNAETINERNFFGRRLSTAHQTPLSPSEASTEPNVDYDDSKLFGMSYDELANESFDHNPRADSSKLPLSHLADSRLDDRLNAALHKLRRPEDQAAFLTSLPMAEWEEAGDWFLARFGDLLGRFKNVRRMRRDVASEFENEIRQRNEAVSRKRICVEDDIVRIRGQGLKVLPDTPARRTRASTPAGAFTPRR